MTTVELTYMPPGNAGVRERTIPTMWCLALCWSPVVRRQAELILYDLVPEQSSSFLQAAAFYRWVQEHLTYAGDHLVVEELRGPEQLLADIRARGYAYADCDDYVILLGALLAAMGIKFSIITTSAGADQIFDHTFLLVSTEQGEIVADPIPEKTGAPHPFGWHVPWGSVTNIERHEVPSWAGEIPGMR